MIENWELRVWSPKGDGPRTIPRDASHIPRTGLRMQITPEQDCREAAFEAKGTGIGLRPLDCVQIVYGGVPLFYGEVRIGGNVRAVDAQRYVLRSLALRLKEVTLSEGFSAPQQAAHLTVRALIQDVINSGQLGTLGGESTILYDPALCPDLGFDVPAVVRSNQQNPYALLEQIASCGLRQVRFGVRADRKFFCIPAQATERVLQPSELASVTWREPVAEAPCTAVLWFVGQRDDGGWETHISQSQEAALYGRRIKAVTITDDTGAWETVPYTLEFRGGGVNDPIESWPQVQPANTFDQALLTDKVTDKHADIQLDVLQGEIRASSTVPFDRIRVSITANSWHSDNPEKVNTPALNTYLHQSNGVVQGPSTGGRFDRMVYPDTPATTFRLDTHGYGRNNPDGSVTWNNRTTLNVAELRPERLRRDLLDQMAQRHYKTPAPEPADIELRTFIPPASLPKYVTLNDYQSIVDAWEYRLTAARGMTLACLAGQAEDPAALAQADLIKARDGAAVITAITAGGTA